MRAAEAQAVLVTVQNALDATGTVVDQLVGRDTYPLWEDDVGDPFAFYVASEIERIRSALTGLQSTVEQYREWVQPGEDRRTGGARRTPEGPGAQFSRRNLGSDRRELADRRTAD